MHKSGPGFFSHVANEGTESGQQSLSSPKYIKNACKKRTYRANSTHSPHFPFFKKPEKDAAVSLVSSVARVHPGYALAPGLSKKKEYAEARKRFTVGMSLTGREGRVFFGMVVQEMSLSLPTGLLVM